MVSICCTPAEPDYDDLASDEKKIFCRLVYLLRKRGYPVGDAQRVALRKVLESCLPYEPA